MTTTEFIKIAKTAHTPQFKNLIGLVKSGKTSILLDFMTYLHPNTVKEVMVKFLEEMISIYLLFILLGFYVQPFPIQKEYFITFEKIFCLFKKLFYF